MTLADTEALKPVLPLLRRLRDIRELREKSPGCFYLRATAFLHFHDESGTLVADLKRTGGGGFDRYPLDTPLAQRKLVDDAKRRVVRLADDE